MSPTARTLSSGGVLDRARRNSPPRDRAVVRRELEGALAIRPAGDVLMGGASGAGSLLLNTKVSQEAACSRAPAAIVPSQEPESRDEGVDAAEGHAVQVEGSGSSEFTKHGSHLEETPITDAAGVHVGGLGSSGNTGIGSHLAATVAAEGLAGGVPPGVNENGQVGRWDIGNG